jgi:hypothetical protein
MIPNSHLLYCYKQFVTRRNLAFVRRVHSGPPLKRSYHGIGVDKDRYARQWQRWNRFAEYTYQKLMERLKGERYD